MLRNRGMPEVDCGVEGLPVIVVRRADLRPSPRQVLRNEDIAEVGGEVERLAAGLDHRCR